MSTGQRAQRGDGVRDGYIDGIDKLPEQLARPEPSLSMLGPMPPPEATPLENPEPEAAPDKDDATTSGAATTGSSSGCTWGIGKILPSSCKICRI
jgi:hypothetical protein